MNISGIAPLAGISLVTDVPRTPFHRMLLDASGNRVRGWLLRYIDEEKKSERKVIAVTHPEEILQHLPRKEKTEYESFIEELKHYRKEWGFNWVPAFKRFLRLYREEGQFKRYRITTIVHHYGGVPGLIVGRVDNYPIVLFPERFGHNSRPNSDDEQWELLYSYNELLNYLFLAYEEQIAIYLASVFFGTEDHKVMSHCLRILLLNYSLLFI